MARHQDSIFYVSPLVDFVWSADIWNPEPCLKAGSMGIASKHDPVLKSPCIVDDPDIVPLAAKRIVEAAFTSAGMWPYKPSYVITLPKLKARMVEELCKAIDDMFVTNPFFKDEYSRLPDPLVLDQVKALLIEHTDLVAHSRLEVDGAGESSMTVATAVADDDLNGAHDLGDPDMDDDTAFHSPLLSAHLAHAHTHTHAPAPAHDASRPTPRVRKPHRPPRGGVVAGGRWYDDSLVVHPTVVVCDSGSPLLTEPGQGPILPVLALSKREMLAFVRVRQPFGVLYHFTRKRDKFAPQFARCVVINNTLSPFRVNEHVARTLAAGAPAARALFDLFSIAQPQVFAPRNALARRKDDRARYPPTTRGKLARLEKDLGWRTIPVPRAPWRERVVDWIGATVPGLVQAVAVGSTLACVVLVGVIAKERMGR
ncbi:hypothetical protein BCR44DRAFT_1036148 [Catenaria anguillulae PL171]|uniref:Uncharacterized protein n=1 Tax=Catenaria anguillulae PL171 TaxID=765915 RepID=A0A1Y2HV00_9FUNG|nr:hypothetical protein BCR44DRAFT_1036148 [Catenaria anguillulae PL171]